MCIAAPPHRKNSPLAAQLKIAFRRFLLIIRNVLKPLTYESRHKLQCTENFIDAIKTKKIPDDYELLSFDVKSLFIATPLQLAIDCSTEVAIKNSAGDLLLNNSELPLLTDYIMDLLNLCLTSTYFQYNGKVTLAKSHMEQLWVFQFLLLQKKL